MVVNSPDLAKIDKPIPTAQPAEYDDHCEAESDCPHGDGMYCGKTLNKNLHHLYRCTSGVLKDMGYCPNGCKQTADGVRLSNYANCVGYASKLNIYRYLIIAIMRQAM